MLGIPRRDSKSIKLIMDQTVVKDVMMHIILAVLRCAGHLFRRSTIDRQNVY